MPAPKIVSFAPKVDGFQESPDVIASLKGWKHHYWCSSETCAAYLAKHIHSRPSQRTITHSSETPPADVHCRVVFKVEDKGFKITAGQVCNGLMQHDQTYPRVVTPLGA